RDDFARFDLILAMDEENVDELKRRAPSEYHGRIRLLMEFAANAPLRYVPDPYYGGPSGFEQVLNLLEEAAEGLLEEVLRRQRRAGARRWSSNGGRGGGPVRAPPFISFVFGLNAAAPGAARARGAGAPYGVGLCVGSARSSPCFATRSFGLARGLLRAFAGGARVVRPRLLRCSRFRRIGLLLLRARLFAARFVLAAWR